MFSKLCAVLVLLTSMGFAKEAPSQLPAFKLPNLQGTPQQSSSWQGKVVVLDFWATWCVACRDAFPVLEEIQNKYGEKILIFGISSDKGSAEKVAKFVKKFKIAYPILHDNTDSMSAIFGFTSIPALYVYDQHGKLVLSLSGLDEANVKKLHLALQKTFEVK